MHTFARQFWISIIVIGLCSQLCLCQDMALDFEQALAMVPSQPRWPNGIMYYDMEDAVDSFVSKHSDPATVSFLHTKMEDPRFARLALFCLARLTPTGQNAKKILYEQIDRSNSAAIVPIAYLHPADARPSPRAIVKRCV